MGIDGRLLYGDGILINPYYIPDDMFDFLSKLSDKYPYLFEYNYMDGVNRNKDIIIWGENPTYLFPVDTGNRTPLIIDNKNQLSRMKPIFNMMNLDDNEIWSPSYGDFTIQLNDYYDKEDLIRQKVVRYITNNKYEVNTDYLDFSSFAPNMLIPTTADGVYLTENEMIGLVSILTNKQYTLVGKFMVYIAN